MKPACLFVTIVMLLAATVFTSMAQSVNLPKESKFRFGDNMQWASPAFNDSDWGMQQLGKSFSKDSSYGWYRIKVVIPSAMKSSTGKGVKLYLGKIDDADQTFFNGKLIGESGSFPPNYSTQWEKQRMYIVPDKEVQWDKENVIAVRVYNLIGGMGMWEGPYRVEPSGWMDEVAIKEDIAVMPGNTIAAAFTFTNKTGNAFNGKVTFRLTGKASHKILFSAVKQVQLQPAAGAVTNLTFPGFTPGKENVFIAGTAVTDDNSPLIYKDEQLFIDTFDLKIPFTGLVQPVIQDKVPGNFTSLPFSDQHFNGYLNTRFTQNLEQRLLKVDEFGLMGSYLHRPGIHPWAGEHVGKYLETACNTWKLTQDPALKKQMDRMMYELINTQLDDGYLGTYTPGQYWTSWDVWSHKYNLHGLLAYYSTTGYQPALEACKKIGNLLCTTFGNKQGQLDIITAGEHMGMAATSVLDAMVELYRYTGNKKYLGFCYYILDAWEQDNGPKLVSTMLTTGKVKNVGNGKAYEMLSNYVGLIKLYKITGDKKMLKAVEMAWQDVVTNQLYITGTSSVHEYFQDDGYLPAAGNDNMGEGCVTTTWLQLNQQLFALTGDIKYFNQLERTVYNHLLAAENPQTGCVSYYTPLMDKKPYTCFITCCQSSVPRGIAMVPNFTFGNIGDMPTVLFYEPAVYREKISTGKNATVDVVFSLTGDFPASGNMILTVNSIKSALFSVALRIPWWCSNYTATAGNKVYKGNPGEFIIITKNWGAGEKIMIQFDMPLTNIAGGKTYPGQIAFQRGPQVLALDKSLNTAGINDMFDNAKENVVINKPVLTDVPELLPPNWVGKQAYTVNMVNQNGKIILVPFAEASQAGGDMRVWLPLRIQNK